MTQDKKTKLGQGLLKGMKEAVKMTQDKKTEDEMSENFLKTRIEDYCNKLVSEQDSLVARYLYQLGLQPSDICLVERETQTGRVFYPDLKSKHFDNGDELQKLRDENEALRSALELVTNNVTWYAKATDGSDVLYTYGYFVKKCQEVLAKYPRGKNETN